MDFKASRANRTERFERIVNEHAASIYRLAFSYVGNRADAEDICQVAFMRLYQCDNEFEDDDHVRAWLLRVTINACKDLLRSSWKKRVFCGEPARSAAEEEIRKASMRKAREDSVSDGLMDDIEFAMKSLSPKQRAAIHLFYFEDLAINEIAHAMEEKPSTVRSFLRRGRNKLRKLLGEYDD